MQVNLNFQSHEVQCTLHIIEQNKDDAPCQEMKEQPSHTAEVLCLNEHRFDFYKIVLNKSLNEKVQKLKPTYLRTQRLVSH